MDAAIDSAQAAAARSDSFDKLVGSSGISVDRLPMLRVIFDRMATGCSEMLRHMSSAACFLNVADIGTARIGDVIDRHAGGAIVALFHAVEWDARVLVAFDRKLIFGLVDALFGGDGAEAAFEDDRTLTNIEARIAQWLFEHVGTSLSNAFATVNEVTFRFERIENRLEFLAVGRRNTVAIVTRLTLKTFDRVGTMFVLIPQVALNPIRQNLARDVSTDKTAPDPRWTKQMQTEVSRAEITLRGILDEQVLTLDDVASLKVGQVLKLQATPTSRVKLECNNEALFWCQLGQADGHYTLRVDDCIEEHDPIQDIILRRA